ncbi:probable 4-coumarate--CoA ligase 3 [Phlebotomus argentipes]|uniref:probable 4-coumarate--CoA ligase 3 n=1 Tax=Phlebotomus argentipes TaxID=94469 RepID=UPI002893573D|nr:probable 4-coumarate--CoA ligase 3 [Phlebotomus argentipes]
MSATKFNSETKVWSRSGSDPPSPMFHEKVTIGRAILYLLNLRPEAICQISADDGSERCNGEIYHDTLKIALNLQRNGCARNDVVSFICRNSHSLTSAVLAAFFLAAPASPMDTYLTKDEMSLLMKTTRPKFIFCDDDIADKVKNIASEINSNAVIIVLGERIPNVCHIDDFLKEPVNFKSLAKEILMNPPEVDAKSCAIIACTSGTTGFIKGLKRIITKIPFNPERLIDIVKEFKVNFLLASTGSTVQLVCSSNLTEDSLFSVKFYVCIGSLISKEFSDKFKPYLRNGIFFTGYGLTECGSVTRVSKPLTKTNVGCLMEGVQAKIVDDNGRKLGIEEDGEICVQTPEQFLGYYGDSKATNEAMDEDGWLKTGDIGHFDEDGFLHVTGRKKDWFKYISYKISPYEVEQILKSYPGISEAVVIGIPDPVYIELPAAVVIKSVLSITEEDLIKLVEEQVSDYKRLRGGVFFLKEFPMTASGKIRRMQVRELAIDLYKEKNSSK